MAARACRIRERELEIARGTRRGKLRRRRVAVSVTSILASMHRTATVFYDEEAIVKRELDAKREEKERQKERRASRSSPEARMQRRASQDALRQTRLEAVKQSTSFEPEAVRGYGDAFGGDTGVQPTISDEAMERELAARAEARTARRAAARKKDREEAERAVLAEDFGDGADVELLKELAELRAAHEKAIGPSHHPTSTIPPPPDAPPPHLHHLRRRWARCARRKSSSAPRRSRRQWSSRRGPGSSSQRRRRRRARRMSWRVSPTFRRRKT